MRASVTFFHLFAIAAILVLGGLSATPANAQSTLKITDQKVGTGAEARDNTQVTVHYTGWLMDGTKFDSSLDRGQPFNFTIGARQVIPGWELGVKGMKVGGKRELIIPPHMAYGRRGIGPIPPDAVLRFEIDLLDVKY